VVVIFEIVDLASIAWELQKSSRDSLYATRWERATIGLRFHSNLSLYLLQPRHPAGSLRLAPIQYRHGGRALHRRLLLGKNRAQRRATMRRLLFLPLQGVLFDPDEDSVSFWNVLVHGLLAVVVLVDLFLAARPWYWEHLYQPALFGVVYALFTLVYTLSGGVDKDGNEYVYKVLDWKNEPATAAAWSAAATAAAAMLHLVNYGLCRARMACAASKRRESVHPVGRDDDVYSIA